MLYCVVDSNPYQLVAQLVERSPRLHSVVGLNPSWAALLFSLGEKRAVLGVVVCCTFAFLPPHVRCIKKLYRPLCAFS